MKATVLAVAPAMALISAFCSTASATKTFYADEGLTYHGSGHCGGGTLPNLVSDVGGMVSVMRSDGWVGGYFTDAAAWPQDFRESCSATYGNGGEDSTFGDAYAVSIYSGHGGSGFAEFPTPISGECYHNLGANGRLGSMAGAQSVVGVYSSCDTLAVNALAGGANWQWERENLGFHGLVDNGLSYVYAWAYDISTEGNAQGWLDAFGETSFFTAAEPAIAVAYGTSGSDCWNTYNQTSMKNNTLMTPRSGGPGCGNGQPLFYYCYGTVN